MEITVNIHGLDPLAQAITTVAQAIVRGRGGTLAAVAVPAAQVPIVPYAAAATPATAAAASAAPAPPVVPAAAAPTYKLEELLQACAPLMDAGKTAELQALVAGFGVKSMMEVPAERYGELATALRSLGARL